MTDINYFYIDESGDLNNQSMYFLIGCIITDTPEDLIRDIELLATEIKNRSYFSRFRKNFLETGFHACTNHLDIYSKFVALLPRLNFRYYAQILDKHSEHYLAIIKSKTKEEIYDGMLISLLKDRITKRSTAINKMYFEQNLPNPSQARIIKRENQLAYLIKELNFKNTTNKHLNKDLSLEISVQDKKTQPIFAVVDFMNHIVMKVYEGKNGKVENYMKENYRLVEPKIGCIHDVAHNIFHKPRKKEVAVDRIFNGC